MKKFYHDFISEADCAAQPYHVATITPVTHYCMAVWKLMRIQQSCEVAILFWIGWFSAVWQELVPGTC